MLRASVSDSLSLYNVLDVNWHTPNRIQIQNPTTHAKYNPYCCCYCNGKWQMRWNRLFILMLNSDRERIEKKYESIFKLLTRVEVLLRCSNAQCTCSMKKWAYNWNRKWNGNKKWLFANSAFLSFKQTNYN